MPYKIKASDENKIVLVRTTMWQSIAGIILVALFLMAISVALNFGSFEASMALDLFKILAPLFSIALLLIAIQQPHQEKQNPKLITFDNAQGVAIIELSGEGSETGYIRYDEISNFDLYIESRRSSKSNSGRTTYRYYVYLKKKDGGRWYLTNLSSNYRAQAILSELNSKVNLTRPTTIQIRTELSEKITKDDIMDKTTISWQNKVKPWPIIYLALFGIIFYIIASALYREGNVNNLDGSAFFALIFILGLFALIMVFNIFTVIKDATTRYAVAINKSDLEYFEYKSSQDVSRNLKSMPLKEIHSISYTFSAPAKQNLAGIEILSHQQFADAQNQSGGFLQTMNKLFQRRTKGIRLNIKSMNAVECQQLESWLQATIKKKSGLEVI